MPILRLLDPNRSNTERLVKYVGADSRISTADWVERGATEDGSRPAKIIAYGNGRQMFTKARWGYMTEKGVFRQVDFSAVKDQYRCLIPISGFSASIDVTDPDPRKLILDVKSSGASCPVIAGIWQPESNDGPLSFAVVTTEQTTLGLDNPVRLPMLLSGSQQVEFIFERKSPRQFQFNENAANWDNLCLDEIELAVAKDGIANPRLALLPTS